MKKSDLLRLDEKALGFDDSWTEETVAVVIYPLGTDWGEAIEGFFNTTGIQKEKAEVSLFLVHIYNYVYDFDFYSLF